MLLLRTTLSASCELNLPNQRLVARCYYKFISLFANDSQNRKSYPDWAAMFRMKYCPEIFQQCISYLDGGSNPDE